MSQEALVFVAENLNQHEKRKLTDSLSGEVAAPEVNTSLETADGGAILAAAQKKTSAQPSFFGFSWGRAVFSVTEARGNGTMISIVGRQAWEVGFRSL